MKTKTSQFLGPMIRWDGTKGGKGGSEVEGSDGAAGQNGFHAAAPNARALDLGLRFLYSKKNYLILRQIGGGLNWQ